MYLIYVLAHIAPFANVAETKMPVIDSLGEEFLEYVKDGMKITIKEDGVVVVD